jgi:transcriptional regulator with XRE-family HTH domain
MTQAALAKKMGISQQAYAKLDSPDANLTTDTLERAARALGMRNELELVPRAAEEIATAG